MDAAEKKRFVQVKRRCKLRYFTPDARPLPHADSDEPTDSYELLFLLACCGILLGSRDSWSTSVFLIRCASISIYLIPDDFSTFQVSPLTTYLPSLLRLFFANTHCDPYSTMTTLSQVLAEARVLVTRLHDREKLADGAVAQSQSLNEKINCMKEYQEDLHELNNVCHQKPRSNLVHSLQQENRQIRQLQNDNRQLKVALEEHQQVLELLMQRHRQLMLKVMQLSQLQDLAEKAMEASIEARHRQLMLKVMQLSQLQDLAEKAMEASIEATSDTLSESSRVYDLSRVVDECLRVGETASHKDQEELARLRAENSTLRQLLKIAAPNDPDAVAKFSAVVAEHRAAAADKQRPCTSRDTADSLPSPASPLSTSVIAASSVPASASSSSLQPKLNGVIIDTHSITGPPAVLPLASVPRRRSSVEEKDKPKLNGNNNEKKAPPPPPSATIGSSTLVKRAVSLDKPVVNGVASKAPARSPHTSTVPVKPALSVSGKRKTSLDAKAPQPAPPPPPSAVKQKANGVGAKAVRT
uniref:Cortactin-binding protein-2 N-terminal domain-containing protein n=1 Tax=Plectus sambesii TaxID=2011161 RepID=A0A914WGF7_9BILA